jgi:hypothetical protein
LFANSKLAACRRGNLLSTCAKPVSGVHFLFLALSACSKKYSRFFTASSILLPAAWRVSVFCWLLFFFHSAWLAGIRYYPPGVVMGFFCVCNQSFTRISAWPTIALFGLGFPSSVNARVPDFSWNRFFQCAHFFPLQILFALSGF